MALVHKVTMLSEISYLNFLHQFTIIWKITYLIAESLLLQWSSYGKISFVFYENLSVIHLYWVLGSCNVSIFHNCHSFTTGCPVGNRDAYVSTPVSISLPSFWFSFYNANCFDFLLFLAWYNTLKDNSLNTEQWSNDVQCHTLSTKQWSNDVQCHVDKTFSAILT